jgi:hypothetical protein
MIKPLTLVSLLATLAGCAQPDETPTCRALHLSMHAPPGTYASQLERADICVKTVARELTRAGGPPADAARAAVHRCATDEAAAIAALKKTGPVWPYQKRMIHDGLAHLAAIAAIQARSTGCGRKAGEPADTPETS